MANETRPDQATAPISAKTPRKATAAEEQRTDTDLAVNPKAVAEAKGEQPVSLSVEQGDTVVDRNDYQRTIGKVAPEVTGRMSEGVRAELEMNGVARDPLTGRMLTRDDLPKDTGKPADAPRQ